MYPWHSAPASLIPSCPLVNLLRQRNFSFLTLRFALVPKLLFLNRKKRQKTIYLRKQYNTTRNYCMISVFLLRGRNRSFLLFFSPKLLYFTLKWSNEVAEQRESWYFPKAGDVPTHTDSP